MKTWLWIIFLTLISDAHSIQTRVQRPVRFVDEKPTLTRNFRHIDSSIGRLDWEHGLRESTVQALFRERIGDQNLRKHIYSAPLLGKQNKASPFGDIAILARGQLYANHAGFIFVQDPYQNDCDHCHHIDAELVRGRCINDHCQTWHTRNNEQLIALWSIKRVRHRGLEGGHNRLEIEFTISPIGLRHSKAPYLTKEGTFNYNVPGHVFILRTSETHQQLKVEEIVNPYKQGAFIAQTPDGTKYILHSFPGILTPETHRYESPKVPGRPTTVTTTQTSEQEAKKVYQTLLEVLHKKTSLSPDRFTPPTQKTSTTISATTLVQVVPITELETPFITKTTPGYVTVKSPETSTSSHPLFKPSTISQTVIPTTSQFTPQTYPSTATTKHTTQQISFATTTKHTTSVVPLSPRVEPQSVHGTVTTKQTTTVVPSSSRVEPQPQTSRSTAATKTIPQQTTAVGSSSTGTTRQTTLQEATFVVPSTEPQTHHSTATTKQTTAPQTTFVLPTTATPPVKMTFHFFAAEEEKPTTIQASRKPATTTTVAAQQEYTENVLPDNIPITEPSKFFVNSDTTTRAPRPAIVVKVTKPFIETTYFTNEISNTRHPTEAFNEPSTTAYYTTKKPYTDFTIPITVLEEASEENYPTSDIVGHQTPPITVSGVKYTDTQFYNPTTTERGADTTILQSTVADTTFKLPEIETNVGLTTIMGTSHNETVEMTYYTAEETKSTPPPTSPIASTRPTNVVMETEQMSTPKRIVTTIAADGKVSVKTTPFYPEEELFGLTKGSTRRPKTTKSYRISTTEPSDFLVETGPEQDRKIPLFKKPLKDYSDDEIFGATKSASSKPLTQKAIVTKYIKSDVEEALFDRSRRSKALRPKKSSTTESSPQKVLYSQFFEASTRAMTAQPEATTLPTVNIIATTLDPEQTTAAQDDKTVPVTSQSYLTSISYKINRRKKFVSKERTDNNKNATDEDPKLTKRLDADDDKVLYNDFASRLVSQAKGVAYLDNVSTTSTSTIASTGPRTTKKSKYTRRRTYVPRAKRPKRKKNGLSGNNR